MHGAGTFFDARLNNKDQYPVGAKSGAGNTRSTPDTLTSKLAALHLYQRDPGTDSAAWLVR